ncbi:MAG: hypothetical protein FWF82_07120, partial [Oscillospiraceae bacterium]|nr:hypothetical protein [Oscillospiraceae bacterium]
MTLNDSIKNINGVSDKRAALYKRLGIVSVGDLLTHYPRDYIDFNVSVPISDINGWDSEQLGGFAVIRAFVSKKMTPYLGKVAVYKLSLTDE